MAPRCLMPDPIAKSCGWRVQVAHRKARLAEVGATPGGLVDGAAPSGLPGIHAVKTLYINAALCLSITRDCLLPGSAQAFLNVLRYGCAYY